MTLQTAFKTLTATVILGLTGCGDIPASAPIQSASNDIPALKTFTDYHIITRGGQTGGAQLIDIDSLARDLLTYDVIFIGEAHGHVGNHRAQADILAALHAIYPDIALSMEQFDRPRQAVLDSYLAGEIGEETLIFEGQAWDGYKQSYRPLIEFAKHHSMPVIAAQAPTSIVRCIREHGPDFINALPRPDEEWVAETLELSDGAYKDKFYSFLNASSHGASDDSGAKNAAMYAAQVARDQTMAQSIARRLDKNPGQKIIHINGSFHSASLLGTPERVAQYRPDTKMINIHPVLVGNPNHPNAENTDFDQGQYLILLHDIPERFVQMSKINEFIARTGHEVRDAECGD